MFRRGVHSELFSSLETVGASLAIYELHADTTHFKLVSANTLYEQFIDKPISNCIEQSTLSIFPRYTEKLIQECFQSCLRTKTTQEIEVVIEQHGTSQWWRAIASPLFPLNNHCDRVINTCIEITDKKNLEQQLDTARQRFQAVIESAYDGIITINQKQNIMLINHAARDIFKIPKAEELIGTNLSRIIPPRYHQKHLEYAESFQHAIINSRQMHSRAPVMGLRADGTEVLLEVAISKIKVGSETEMTAIVRDLSERERLIEELSRAASRDSLTGLYNRRFIISLLNKELERCRRFKHTCAIALIDLDHFKKINDLYGHPCGDKVLLTISEVLLKNTREIDTCCRWGGEEFLVILPEVNLAMSAVWAERAREQLALTSIKYDGAQAINVTASFGLIATDGESETIESLIKRVDQALYQAKEGGRNQVCVSE